MIHTGVGTGAERSATSLGGRYGRYAATAQVRSVCRVAVGRGVAAGAATRTADGSAERAVTSGCSGVADVAAVQGR